MSRENVEIVRRHMDAFRAGDVTAALTAYRPEVIFDARVRPEGRIYRGRDDYWEAVRAWVGTFDDYTWEIEELIDADERVLMALRECGRGKGSRVEVIQQSFWIYELRDGQIVHATVLVDRAEALEAVGLSE